MKAGGSSKAAGKSFGKYSKADIATGPRWYDRFDEDTPKDPTLRQEIEGFLDWLHGDNGLDAWVAYYYRTKDPDWPIIARLLKGYNEIKKEFDLKKGLKVKKELPVQGE
jgi:hypothetical protein